jgi:hypothetical protein
MNAVAANRRSYDHRVRAIVNEGRGRLAARRSGDPEVGVVLCRKCAERSRRGIAELSLDLGA